VWVPAEWDVSRTLTKQQTPGIVKRKQFGCEMKARASQQNTTVYEMIYHQRLFGLLTVRQSEGNICAMKMKHFDGPERRFAGTRNRKRLTRASTGEHRDYSRNDEVAQRPTAHPKRGAHVSIDCMAPAPTGVNVGVFSP
jgi:hypothetical protein